ncbi:MAG: Transcriptional regulator KdgR [Pseudomonadota bacterium]
MTTESSSSKSSRLSSVAAAVRVLKCFSEVEPEIGISSLAKRLSLAKSTVHRLAVTLTSEGLLEQSPETGRYRLGINLFVMGALVRRRLDVSNMAQPFLNVLREQTGETIHLAPLQPRKPPSHSHEELHRHHQTGLLHLRRPGHCGFWWPRIDEQGS